MAGRLISQADAADEASVSVKTIRRWISQGRLTGYRAGPKLLRVDRDELMRMIAPIPAAERSA